MKNKLQKLFTILLLCIGVTAHAQQTTTTTGGNASGAGGSVSYTIGQAVYTTNTGTNGSEAQGVQQPYEISVIIGIDEASGNGINLLVYPNPTTDVLTLSISNSGLSNLSFELFDINGKKIENKNIDSNETIISMKEFSAATYILKVIANNKEVKVFQIIKN